MDDLEESDFMDDDEDFEDDFFDEEDDWDDLHTARQKPVLDEETVAALSFRAKQKKKATSFQKTRMVQVQETGKVQLEKAKRTPI